MQCRGSCAYHDHIFVPVESGPRRWRHCSAATGRGRIQSMKLQRDIGIRILRLAALVVHVEPFTRSGWHVAREQPSCQRYTSTRTSAATSMTCALALVLRWPGADLVAVTTNTENDGRPRRLHPPRCGWPGADRRWPRRGGALGCYRGMPGLPDEAAYWPEPVAHLRRGRSTARWPCSNAASSRAVDRGHRRVHELLALLEHRSPGILRRAHL